MENLSLNNENTQLNIWEIIKDIDWNTLSKNNSNPNDSVAEFLINHFTLEQIIKISNEVVTLRCKMQDFISDYMKTNNDLYISDDGVWDLAAHIVGLGYETYNSVLNNSKLLPILNKTKKENFEYGFDKAIYEIQYSLNNKITFDEKK